MKRMPGRTRRCVVVVPRVPSVGDAESAAPWPARLWVPWKCLHTKFGKTDTQPTTRAKGVSLHETYTARALARWEVCLRPMVMATLVICVTIG